MNATVNPPLIDKEGRHWQGHGKTVYHSPRWSAPEARLTAADVTAYSRADAKRPCEVLLCVGREPFSLSLCLEPADADALADALRQAAEQVRAVRAIQARRGAAPGAAAEVRP